MPPRQLGKASALLTFSMELSCSVASELLAKDLSLKEVLSLTLLLLY